MGGADDKGRAVGGRLPPIVNGIETADDRSLAEAAGSISPDE